MRYAIAPTKATTIGSINSFASCIKMKTIGAWGCYITGNIETAFNSMNRFNRCDFVWDKYVAGDPYGGDVLTYSTNISGNINVFANKYDLVFFQIQYYTNVNGQLKDLKNLKKFLGCYLSGCSATGSKTDLWNQGANITDFRI